METLQIPAKAVETFEQTTGLDLSYHVVDMGLWSFLPSVRALHFSPACVAVKHSQIRTCIDFEQRVVRSWLRRRSDGFVKVCHAGLIEWVVPVQGRSGLAMVLFAGQRRAAQGLADLDPVKAERMTPGLGGMLTAVPTVTADEARRMMELTCQLGARFEQWISRMESMTAETAPASPDRARWIEMFILRYHTSPISIDDLAKGMGLSPGRAAHVVKESTGRSFGDLLAGARVKTAAALLTHTNLPLTQIADRSGFGDLSNFHRRFRARMGSSPHQYRKLAEPGRRPVELTVSIGNP